MSIGKRRKNESAMADPFDPFADANPKMVKPRITRKPKAHANVPSGAELGRRFSALRSLMNLSREDVAQRIHWSTNEIARFEENGSGSMELLLALLAEFSSSTGFATAFKVPKLRSYKSPPALDKRTPA